MSTATDGAARQDPPPAIAAAAPPSSKNYKGFVAGVFSGIGKLSVGHPFDTIKVRLQTTEKSHFRGPLDCVLQTVRNEGFRGLYKGASPPLVGWMFMDSIMLGSLNVYRRLLSEHVFPSRPLPDPSRAAGGPHGSAHANRLPALGHGVAGTLAGCTVSFVAAPVEHVKARLQVQYAADKAKRLYKGPVDCVKKLMASHGLRGLYHGLAATLLFRSFFFIWWSSYDLLTLRLTAHTALPPAAVNFWAGGLSAQLFWCAAYPSDVVKQRVMTDDLDPRRRKYARWWDAASAVGREGGWRGYWRGFVPCFLRAFPANAVALVAYEGVMRALP